MSNQKRVQGFLGRLESSANDKIRGLKALQAREELHLSPYLQTKTWPGNNYIYLGYLENLEDPFVRTEGHLQRTTCIKSLLESGGNENHCVSVEQALRFEGFVQVLSRFELSMLQRIPQDTLISPAYCDNGELLPTAFTLWQALSALPVSALASDVAEQESRILLSA